MLLRRCIYFFASVILIDVAAADMTCGYKTCPDIFDQDAKYCCEFSDGTPYCCNEGQFFGRMGLSNSDVIDDSPERTGIIVTIIVIITGILIACCLCCLCCPCCLLYKRRNAGTVYTPAVNTSVVVQSQQAVIQPMQPNVPYPVQPQSAGYPAPGYMPMPMPQVATAAAAPVPLQDPGYMQQPPPYSVAVANDPYVKQAPYNPTY